MGTVLVHLASLLGLGLAMGFSPTLYGLSIHLLARSREAALAIRWMAFGLAVGSTLLVLLFQVVDPENLTHALRGRVDELLLRRSVDLAAAAALLLAALGLLWRVRRHPGTTPRPPRAGAGDHPRRSFYAGLANAVIGTSGIAVMYVTGRVASDVSPDLLLRMAAYSVFLLTLVGPYLAASWAWTRWPGPARRITAAYDWAASRDLRPLAVLGMAVAGVVFIVLGIRHHG